MDLKIFLPLFLVSTIFTAVIIVYIIRRKKTNKLVAQYGGRVAKDGSMIVPSNGRECRIYFYPGSSKSKGEFRVFVAGEFGGYLTVRYENLFDRFFKRIGLNRELEIPQREANDKLYFECEDQQFLKMLFLNPETKERIFDLLKRFTSIEITPKRCTLRKVNPNYTELNKSIVDDAIQALNDLTAIVPRTNSSPVSLNRLKIVGTVSCVVGIVVLLLGIALSIWGGFYPVVDAGRVWNTAANYFMPAILVVGYLVYWAVKGFSTTSKYFVPFILTFALGAALCGRFGLAVLNGVHDRQAAVAFQSPVINKYTTTHKGSTTYHVLIGPWRIGGKNWHFTVSSREYDTVWVGQTVYEIITKPGALGFEWVWMTKQVIDEARVPIVWPPKDYSHWNVLPANLPVMDAAEAAYWRQWVKHIEPGITVRMGMQEYLRQAHGKVFYERLLNDYLIRQQRNLNGLNQLSVPMRLQPFCDAVKEAGEHQLEFYKHYVRQKQSSQVDFNMMRNDPELQESDKRLWDAYHYFQALYPNVSKEFNDAIEQRLAWFDII